MATLIGRPIQRLLSFLLFLVLIVGSTAQSAELKCDYMQSIIDTMLSQHVKYDKYTDAIETRAVDQYIKTLDASKLYLFESDVKEIKKMMTGIYKKMSKRDCSTLAQVQKIFLKRVEEREKFSEKLLGKEFKFNQNLEIQLDSDKRQYPKNAAQANAFHEKYIQWQVASFVSTDMKMNEAKDQIIRRYQRAFKNLKEQKVPETYSNFLDAVARALDPHSSYFSQDSLEEFEITMRLSLEGIGATLSAQDGYTVIEQLLPGGAAQQSGLLQPQDKIDAVGQNESGAMEPVIDLPLKDVVKMIRGPKGKKVRLSVLRKRGDKTERFLVTLVRSKINLEQDAAHINYIEREVGGQKKKYGVIDLPSFYQDPRSGGRSCYEDVKKLLSEANEKKVDGIVLDLSTNGGGSLDDAVKLAGLFFRKGNVVKTEGAHAPEDILADKDPAVNYAGPLVVLTSRLSASASEIVAGALKDYKRAVIVGGDHTFGKGSVQSVMPLPSSLGAFKITIGMFFIPGGNSTQHRGVEGDVVLPSAFSSKDLGEKSLDYSLPPKSLNPFLSPEAYVTSGESAWKTVEPDTIAKLAANSKKRVAANEEFQKIVKEIKEAEGKTKSVKIAEIMKKKDENKEKEEKRKKEVLDPKLRDQEYMKRPDIQEAVNVVSDLSVIQQSKPVLKDQARNES